MPNELDICICTISFISLPHELEMIGVYYVTIEDCVVSGSASFGAEAH